MFGLIIQILFNIYVLIRFTDKPNQNNFILVSIVYNTYLFGYISTIYLIIMHSGLFLVKNKDVCDRIFHITMFKYNSQVYHNQVINTIREYGDKLFVIINYGRIAISPIIQNYCYKFISKKNMDLLLNKIHLYI
jgi:hypothetical protein